MQNGLLKFLVVAIASILTSCGTYHVSTTRVKSVLAITEAGDTLAVPIHEFDRYKYDHFTRFSVNGNWYWNNWRYDFPFRQHWFNDVQFWGSPYYQWSTPVTVPVPQVRPKVKPKERPRAPRGPRRSNVATPRGARSYGRKIQIPNTTSNVTPARTSRSSSGGRKQNNR